MDSKLDYVEDVCKDSGFDLVCESEHVHETVAARVKDAMPDEGLLYDLAEFFKVFGDSTRTKILSALRLGELCVCDLCSVLSMTKSAVSHQLRILRQTKLCKFRRDGKEIYYSLNDDHIVAILDMGLEHITE